MDSLRAMFGRSHELVQLVTLCLDYTPSRRPTASEAMERLEHISSRVSDAYDNMTCFELKKTVQQMQNKIQTTEPVLIRGLEAIEGELLQEMKKMNGGVNKELREVIREHIVNSRGVRYDIKRGSMGGNTGEIMLLVSVGSEFPADISVQPRIKNSANVIKATEIYGSLPPIVPGLHEEAAADLMATASPDMKSPNFNVVQLCVDVPMMQRSKHYYLKKIREFFEHCKHTTALIHYIGRSEKGTGNWCFKDGTISFQDIFSLYRKYSSSKSLTITTDCCYSGHWVRECAKTLDSLHIPPCGHRARENGTLVKVIASCQPDQEAAEPGYSVEAVTVQDDGYTIYDAKQLSQQRSTWFDGTRLVCCKGPDSPCPKTTFQHLKWEDAVNKSWSIQEIKRKEGGRDKWYYVVLHRAGEAYRETFHSQINKNPSLRLSDWGYVLESGEGNNIPNKIKGKVGSWTTMADV